MKDVAGKTAFITGGASGIGLGMARAFGAAGMRLMLADIEAGALDKAVGELRGKGVQAESAVCDVSDQESVFAAAKAAIDAFGRVHVLCNNAGVSVGGAVEELPTSDWDWVIGVNQMGVVHGLQALLPHMKQHGEAGHVVNTASMAGMVNMDPFWSPYNATKFAVVSISEVLRKELKDTAIGTSVLCPGPVNTRILEADRNRPGRFGEMTSAVAGTDISSFIQEGLAPDTVGELVLSAIQAEQFYIFTEPPYRVLVERRFAEIMAGFDWATAHPLLASRQRKK